MGYSQFQLMSGYYGFARLRQLHSRKPEIIDALYQLVEGLEVHWLAEIAVGLKLIALDYIRFRLGRGEDHGGNRSQAGMLLDVGQHFAAIHFGEIQV